MEGVGLGAAGGGATADFGVFLTDHLAEVGLLAYQLCGERGVAEEVTADAFAEAWRCWDELAGREVPLLESMRGIVERLVQGRVHGTGRKPAPQVTVTGGPDGERIRALLAERITLIPPQDAPTVLIPRIVVPPEPSVPEEAPVSRFRRPTVVSAVITGGTLVALGVIAIAVSSSNGTTAANQSPLSLAASDTIGAGVIGSPTAAVTSGSPSRSASASPSHSPSASPTPSATPSKAPASPTGAASSATASLKPTTVATTASSNALTASGSVGNNNGGWTQLDVTTNVNRTLSALTITITVANCPGLYPANSWNSGAGGQFNETTNQNPDGSVSYVFELSPGNQVSPGQISFAAQFVHSRHGWTASADTYSVAAQDAASGAGDNLGSAF